MSNDPYSNQSSFQRVTQDVLDLFELQMQLLSVDSQDAKRKLTTAVACGAIAATLAGSALTVVMLGGGVLLGETTGLSTGGSLLIVGAAVFAVVAILGWVALSAIKKAASAMSETKSEFTENLRWLKATLVSPKTSPRNQIRRESFDDFETARSRASGWNGSNSVDREPTSTYPR
ncbi:MAG: phage holin family protein [Rubripirellula sp.]